jgi:hypothetical protein
MSRRRRRYSDSDSDKKKTIRTYDEIVERNAPVSSWGQERYDINAERNRAHDEFMDQFPDRGGDWHD